MSVALLSGGTAEIGEWALYAHSWVTYRMREPQWNERKKTASCLKIEQSGRRTSPWLFSECVWCCVKSSSLCTQIKDYQNVCKWKPRTHFKRSKFLLLLLLYVVRPFIHLVLWCFFRCLLHCKYTFFCTFMYNWRSSMGIYD